MRTRQPASAKASAAARPMPVAPPVTTTALPARSSIMSPGSRTHILECAFLASRHEVRLIDRRPRAGVSAAARFECVDEGLCLIIGEDIVGVLVGSVPK